MGTIRLCSEDGYDLPKDCSILIDDINKIVTYRINEQLDFVYFDEIDELRRTAVLSSARGIQLRSKL